MHSELLIAAQLLGRGGLHAQLIHVSKCLPGRFPYSFPHLLQGPVQQPPLTQPQPPAQPRPRQQPPPLPLACRPPRLSRVPLNRRITADAAIGPRTRQERKFFLHAQAWEGSYTCVELMRPS